MQKCILDVIQHQFSKKKKIELKKNISDRPTQIFFKHVTVYTHFFYDVDDDGHDNVADGKTCKYQILCNATINRQYINGKQYGVLKYIIVMHVDQHLPFGNKGSQTSR